MIIFSDYNENGCDGIQITEFHDELVPYEHSKYCCEKSRDLFIYLNDIIW